MKQRNNFFFFSRRKKIVGTDPNRKTMDTFESLDFWWEIFWYTLEYLSLSLSLSLSLTHTHTHTHTQIQMPFMPLIGWLTSYNCLRTEACMSTSALFLKKCQSLLPFNLGKSTCITNSYHIICPGKLHGPWTDIQSV